MAVRTPDTVVERMRSSGMVEILAMSLSSSEVKRACLVVTIHRP